MKTVVLIPTYNEAQNISNMVNAVIAHGVDVLIIDDNSPDGTGQIADGLAAEHERVQVLHRPGKAGLGKAYLAGFAWALRRGYDWVIEMDADGSHRPEDLPALLAARDDTTELIIGSRWTKGGATLGWPWHRQLLSRGGNWYIRRCVDLPVKDATAGFRAYRASLLRRLPHRSIASAGYFFQVEMTLVSHLAGAKIVEVPIVFAQRAAGVSKMSGGIIGEALWRATIWGFRYRALAISNRWPARGLKG